VSEPQALGALIRAASAFYRPAGRFAWYFARGKLKGDPVYTAILHQGLLARRERVLDLGAGQGLLAAWLLAARARHASGRAGAWPPGWPAPPNLLSYTGVEINPQEVRRARRAFARDPQAQLRIVHGDIRDVDYGTPDAVIILDVLHYLDYLAQERILQRVHAALAPGGLLLLRIGDASGGVGSRLSQTFDGTVALMRHGRWLRLHCRPLRQWQRLLSELSFEAHAVPMRRIAGAANTLLVAQVR
jgi:SAM-dependent methyltransferase